MWYDERSLDTVMKVKVVKIKLRSKEVVGGNSSEVSSRCIAVQSTAHVDKEKVIAVGHVSS